MTRIAVSGAAGRMGKMILEVCHDRADVTIGAAIEHKESSKIGMDAGLVAGIDEQGVKIVDNISSVIDAFDVLIDFTHADAVVQNVENCVTAGKRIVIGTTGLSEEQKNVVQTASKEIAIVFAPNMSVGVNLCFKLIEQAAHVIGDNADVEIIEAHHNHKKDAPSGTAVRIGEIIAKVLGRDLKKDAVYGRHGQIGKRDRNTIGFETIRAGDIVGEHTVMFAADGERIEIVHRASSRKNFAIGAVRAANWIMSKQTGLFDMQDVLDLHQLN